MKLAFGILMILHGLLHLIGFAKAFFTTKTPMLVLGISKPFGVLWLFAFVLFMVSSTLWFNNKKWFYLVFVAVCISQILIILAWKEAKFGSIVNAIILLVGISHLADFKFNKMVQKESVLLFKKIEKNYDDVISNKDVEHLPEIVQKWMKNSGVIGSPKINSVRLQQIGHLKNKPTGKWVPFTAKQYFNIGKPSFVWSAKIQYSSLLYILGRDKLNEGNAEMLIKVWGVIPVVDEVDNFKIDSGSIQRFLGEMCWFPSAAISDYISWEYVDDTSAKAIFSSKSQSVSGIFRFNAKGDIVSFETDRFYGGGSDSKKEKWIIDVIDYKVYDTYRIPYKCKVTWRLREGDFNWLNLEVLDVDYNIFEPFEKMLN
ncbi:hypothetical protein EYD45_06735 [Hyunsoonleella flava]|uniref:Uncharacterized protein n=1 Tax=Hyunsoonleella flava TaxID=2527939 RepID=A0A4Q9FJX7_9FLAO|nr:DUF6544 family protein [Hyunsoonleella flava]TBN04309.1 hypothetical protein EYD45_06735 [Hyunsoonleella flava]